jgi:hypothetical protein
MEYDVIKSVEIKPTFRIKIWLTFSVPENEPDDINITANSGF